MRFLNLHPLTEAQPQTNHQGVRFVEKPWFRLTAQNLSVPARTVPAP